MQKTTVSYHLSDGQEEILTLGAANTFRSKKLYAEHSFHIDTVLLLYTSSSHIMK